jgi:hypothetical protein
MIILWVIVSICNYIRQDVLFWLMNVEEMLDQSYAGMYMDLTDVPFMSYR